MIMLKYHFYIGDFSGGFYPYTKVTGCLCVCVYVCTKAALETQIDAGTP